MNDETYAFGNIPTPEPFKEARLRTHSLMSLYAVFGNLPNFRNPGGAMHLRRYASDMSYVDAIWNLNKVGYRTRLECDLDRFQDGKVLAQELVEAGAIRTTEYWTAFVTSSAVSGCMPRYDYIDDGRILRLVFAFLCETDAMLLKLKIPDHERSTFRLTNAVAVLS